MPRLTTVASLRDKIQRQQELRDQRAAQAVKLDALKADDKQVSGAIDALQANVKSHQTKLVQANQRSAAADQELANAQTVEAEKAAYLAEMQSSARRFALQAYVSPTDELGAVMGATDGNGPYRAGLASLQASQFAKALDDLAAAQADLATARATAERAANQASRRKADAVAQLQRLQQVLGQQEQLSDQIDNRLDDALAEADALQALDAQLAGQIRAEQAAVAAQLQAARLAAEQAAARNGISLAAPGSGRSVGSPIGAIAVTTVGGITVNVSIAGQIAALLRDAAAAGINLGRRRLPQLRRPDRRAPQQLRAHAVRHLPEAFVAVPPARGEAGPVDARAGPGHRLHLQRGHHRLAQRAVLELAGPQRRPVRPHGQLPRGVALVDERPLKPAAVRVEPAGHG